jgi:hypothetical protein
MRRDWMLQLCKAYRPKLAQPYPYVLGEGVPWDVATNGYALLAVRGATWAPPPDRPDMSALPDLLATSEKLARPRRILDWAFGAGEWCGACDGVGVLPAYGGEFPEPMCGRCCGEGFSFVQQGTVQGEWFNRRLVYRFLSAAIVHMGPEFTVGRGLPRDPDQARSLMFQGPGWVLHVLGMNPPEEANPEGPELYSEEWF